MSALDTLRYMLSGGVAVHLIWVNIPGYEYRHFMCIDPEELDEQVSKYGLPNIAIYGEDVIHFVD